MKTSKNNSGVALLTVIFIILIFAIMGAGIMMMLFSGSRSMVMGYRYDKAFYLADAGRAFAVKQVSYYQNWSGTMGFPVCKPLGGGCFVVSVATQTATSISLVSTGIITIEGITYQRAITATASQGATWDSQYVLYWGAGGGTSSATLGNNVTFNGDVLINGDVSLGSGAVGSDIYVSGSLSGSTAGFTGTAQSGAPMPTSLPVLNTTYYDNLLAVANTKPTGNQSWNNKTLTGTTYIHGNLTINSSRVITITGSAQVVVTGTVTISNGVTIGNKFTLIAGGLVTVNNSFSIGSNGILFSSTGFSFKNNLASGVVGIGTGTSILTPGDFAGIWNSATISGFMYIGGSLSLNNNTNFTGNIIAGSVDSIGNNSTLTLRNNLVELEDIPGYRAGGNVGMTLGTWREVY